MSSLNPFFNLGNKIMKEKKEGFVAFENVQKTYDGNELVVKNLNLEIFKGEFLTMLGPSGSGKTTCLMMLAGFESSTHGEIRLGGKPIGNIPPHKRGIGMVFQNYALFPHMSVGENLAFPLEVRKIGKSIREEKIKRVLEIVKMTDFINRRPAQLSGGQQQRIALARSLVFEPELVLMDEPLGALDKQLREHMQYEIKHIHEQLGVTVVYVTHDQSEALTMSDRVAVFNEGVVQQLDTPVNIYEKPLNSFVAQFIGENNKLVGTIINESKGVVLAKLRNSKKIKGIKVNSGKEGTDALFSIRPERIFLDKKNSEAIEARVLELIYLGDHVRCRMKVADNEEFIVKIPNSSSTTSLRVGQKTQVSWRVEDCRALDLAN